MSNEKVIFLSKFRKEETQDEVGPTVIACKICSNKTWVLIREPSDPVAFPHVKCACCGQLAGRMGWVHDE